MAKNNILPIEIGIVKYVIKLMAKNNIFALPTTIPIVQYTTNRLITQFLRVELLFHKKFKGIFDLPLFIYF